MLKNFMAKQVQFYMAGKTDQQMLDAIEEIVLPLFRPDQMLKLRDLLNEKIRSGVEAIYIGTGQLNPQQVDSVLEILMDRSRVTTQN